MADVVIVEEKVSITVVDERLRQVRWGYFVLFGIIAIIFGALVLFYPGISTVFMVVLAAALLLVFGLYGIISGFMAPKGEKLAPIVLGIIGALIGAAGLVYPAAFGVSLVVLLGFLILLIGGLMIVFSIIEKDLPHRWLLFFLGLISVIFGIAFFYSPVVAAVGLTILLAIYFIITGVASIITGFQIRSLKKKAFGTSKTPR
ncbi:MAG: DUF308 domain-containing protein [Methanomicrobiales archaeon]|jgi:uncharacterized membrane protein HdeD (DUF308 family)|nr:DUF308 domain-containing protein [Methanomicrobiales archaeon]